jgi:hypothetical protein
MSAQVWYSASWLSTNWVEDDWMPGPIPPGTAQIVANQAPQFAGIATRWVHRDWLSLDWVNGDWLGGGAWQIAVVGAITGITSDWIIPALTVSPVWTFNLQQGLDSRIVGAQAPQVTLITAQFSIAIDRPSQLIGAQAPQTMVATAVFTPSVTLRSGLIAAQQAAQVAAIAATHNFSGGIVNKRYGRK